MTPTKINKSTSTLDSSMDIDISLLEKQISFMIRIAQIEAFDRFYHSFSDPTVRPGEYTCLLVIDGNPGIRQGVLANTLKIKRANMAKVMRRLELDGLLTKKTPANDRRSFGLFLTPKGKAFVTNNLKIFCTQDEIGYSMLTEKEQKRLLSLLHKVMKK